MNRCLRNEEKGGEGKRFVKEDTVFLFGVGWSWSKLGNGGLRRKAKGKGGSNRRRDAHRAAKKQARAIPGSGPPFLQPSAVACLPIGMSADVSPRRTSKISPPVLEFVMTSQSKQKTLYLALSSFPSL